MCSTLLPVAMNPIRDCQKLFSSRDKQIVRLDNPAGRSVGRVVPNFEINPFREALYRIHKFKGFSNDTDLRLSSRRSDAVEREENIFVCASRNRLLESPPEIALNKPAVV